MCSLTHQVSHLFSKQCTSTINHQSCLPFQKLSNDPSKTIGLYSTIHIKKDMLVELCASNYATLDGLMNVLDGIFKTSTTYCDKNHHMEYNVSKF